jgi:drug/metabolite transporter (DMT)-like permease
MPMPTGLFALPYASPFFWSLPMIFLLLCELTADFLGKKWTLHKKSFLFTASLSLYVIGNAFWIFAILNGVGLARGAVIYAIAQEILAVSMGVAYFKEDLSKRQWLGMLLGLFTILLMGGV